MAKKLITQTNEADAIENFLGINNYSKNTKKLYKSSLKKYFKFLEIAPNDYIKQDRSFETDIRKFAVYLKDKPPVSQRAALNAVKQFLEEYDIDIRNKIWKKIKNQRRGNKPLTDDKIPDNEDLKRILSDGNIKCKAYFLLLSSTGMREGEACGIKWEDIELENRKINLRAEITKNNQYRYVFYSPEAEEYLLLWKNMYENYTPKAGKEHKQKCLQNKEDGRVFPFSEHTAWWMWDNLTKKSGYHQKDKVTGRHIYHIHTLRKFFNTKLKINNVPEGVVEKLLGHEGYLNGNYDRFTPEEIKEIYDKNCSALSVFSDIHKLPDMIKPELKVYETKINKLERENIILKKQVSKLQTFCSSRNI